MEFITVGPRGRKQPQADVIRKAAEAAAKMKADMEDRRAKSLKGSEAVAAAAAVVVEAQAKADAVLEQPTKTSWADMDSDDEDECPCAKSEPEAEAPVPEPRVQPQPKALKKSWADMSSDDEDSEDEGSAPLARGKSPEPEVEASPQPTPRTKPEAKKRWADIESDDEDAECSAEREALPPARTSVASQPESEPADADEWTTVTKKAKKAKPAQTLEPPRAPWAKPQQVRKEEPPWRKKRA
jgi:hypothetical protein